MQNKALTEMFCSLSHKVNPLFLCSVEDVSGFVRAWHLWLCLLFLMVETDVYDERCCAGGITKPELSVPDHRDRNTQLSIHPSLSVSQSVSQWTVDSSARAVLCWELLRASGCVSAHTQTGSAVDRCTLQTLSFTSFYKESSYKQMFKTALKMNTWIKSGMRN